MPVLEKKNQLKKELSLLHIYTIATGASIASGFFLLPGLAYAVAGPDMIFSYIIAVIPIIPALFSKSELSTAMPRAGGVYFFMDRSMGPLMGTIGGLGTWLALILKTAFALVGISAYLSLLFSGVAMVPIAVGFALLFGTLNLFGAKKSGGLQIFLVFSVLSLLAGFTSLAFPNLNPNQFSQLFSGTYESIISTAGLVYVSYVGLSKISSVSEEVKDPDKNIPKAMFLALGTSLSFYLIGIIGIIGVVPAEQLINNITPVAVAAEILVGEWGKYFMIAAAFFAFLSVANVGILSASRYPLAMSRDHLMPMIFRKLNKNSVPVNAIYITTGLVIFVLLFFDITKIAKLAGAFQLLLFSFNSLAVIVMRESKIESYDPGYKSPLYPWMQIFGIISPFWIIIEMGMTPILFSFGLLILGALWYNYFAKGNVARDGAIYHIFARLGEQRFEGLDVELRGILKEKGLREKDPFNAVIASATILNIDVEAEFDYAVNKASNILSKYVKIEEKKLTELFMEGTLVGSTPVSNGAALPHLRIPELKNSEIVIIRSKKGIYVDHDTDAINHKLEKDKIHAFFFLISPEENPGQHLRILAQIASHVDDKHFIKRWLTAETEQELKELLLHNERYISLIIERDQKTGEFENKLIKELSLPDGCLIAMIHRKGEMIVPTGKVQLQLNDKLTIIGYPDGIGQLYNRYEN